jgi:hypothetical protein
MTQPTYKIADDFGLQTVADFPLDYAKYVGNEHVPEYGDNENMPDSWCERYKFELFNGRMAYVDVGDDYYWVGICSEDDCMADDNVYSCGDIASKIIELNEGA